MTSIGRKLLDKLLQDEEGRDLLAEILQRTLTNDLPSLQSDLTLPIQPPHSPPHSPPKTDEDLAYSLDISPATAVTRIQQTPSPSTRPVSRRPKSAKPVPTPKKVAHLDLTETNRAFSPLKTTRSIQNSNRTPKPPIRQPPMQLNRTLQSEGTYESPPCSSKRCVRPQSAERFDNSNRNSKSLAGGSTPSRLSSYARALSPARAANLRKRGVEPTDLYIAELEDRHNLKKSVDINKVREDIQRAKSLEKQEMLERSRKKKEEEEMKRREEAERQLKEQQRLEEEQRKQKEEEENIRKLEEEKQKKEEAERNAAKKEDDQKKQETRKNASQTTQQSPKKNTLPRPKSSSPDKTRVSSTSPKTQPTNQDTPQKEKPSDKTMEEPLTQPSRSSRRKSSRDDRHSDRKSHRDDFDQESPEKSPPEHRRSRHSDKKPDSLLGDSESNTDSHSHHRHRHRSHKSDRDRHSHHRSSKKHRHEHKH